MKENDALEPSKLDSYLEACAKKGEKPVEKVMQDGIDNPSKFLGFIANGFRSTQKRSKNLPSASFSS